MSLDVTAPDLEPGDTLRDLEGHGHTNPYGPTFTDKLQIKKRWGKAQYDRWEADSWLLACVYENGRSPTSSTFAVSFATINERLASGRYEIVDCEAHRHLEIESLPVDTEQDIYIRFGDLPDNERSYNSTQDQLEDGVSVYGAELESVPPESGTAGMFVPVGPTRLQIILLAQRDTYLVTGERVGTGADGEPLLRDIEVLAELVRGDAANGWIISSETGR